MLAVLVVTVATLCIFVYPGEFDFGQLLITLTTSLALLAIATTVVDYIALYFMPERTLYVTLHHQNVK